MAKNMKQVDKNAVDDFQDKLMREVEADLKSETIEIWWKKYGIYVIISVVLILFAVVSFETVIHWNDKNDQKWSDQYSIALEMQAIGEYEEAGKKLDALSEKGNKFYQDLAKMQKANLYFDMGEKEKAINVLEELTKDNKLNHKMKDVALIKLASHKADTENSEYILRILSSVANSSSSWSNFAKEIIASVYLKEKEFEKARVLYFEILASPYVSLEQKSRIQDLQSVLSDI